MKKEKQIKYFCSFLFSIILFLSIGLPCSAANILTNDVVRVAYFDLGSYYQPNADGSLNSYDAAYLKVISEYTGLRFEYVNCNTWDEAIEKLENHEIDLVGTMQWTPEREAAYEISDASYGYAVSELASLPENGYIYQDYEQINGSTIGCIETYVIHDQLLLFLEEHDLSAEVKTYQSQTALDNALLSGEIDLVASSSHAMHTDWQIIDKFSYAPFYFASWKGNDELIRSISDAIIKINVYQNDFDDALIEEYFPFLVNSPYNKDEVDYLKDAETYTIYFDDATKPLAWYDSETDSMHGILIDLVQEMGAKSGLSLNIRPISEMATSETMRFGKYYTSFSSANTTYSQTDRNTSAILNETFTLYHLTSHAYNADSEASYRVAIPKGRDGCKEFLSKNYPNYEVVEYDSPAACVFHLRAGDVDLAFMSYYVSNNIFVANDYKDIVSIPTSSASVEIGLTFYGKNASTVANIIDKSYKLLDTDDINNIKLENIATAAPDISLLYIIRNNLTEFVILFCLFLLLLVISIAMVLYMRVIKNKNQMILAANKSKADFYSRMSHDMRTPMNGILGMTQLSKNETNLDVLHHNIDRIEESGVYLLSLINDVLDMSKIESGKVELHEECIDPYSFINSVIDMMKPALADRNITLKTDFTQAGTTYCFFDGLRLKQIYANLLSNAIKFSEPGSTIEWSIRDIKEENGKLYIEHIVRDHGCGMSPEFLEKIFTPFAQETNKYSSETASTGLGLAISKNLIDIMGGTIEVTSKLGEGSQFKILLSHRLSPTPPTSSSNAAEDYSLLAGKHILLTEDHPLNAEIASKLLKKQDMIVSHAEDGEQSVTMFAASALHEYDAILMDIRMPNMDGLEATKAIRALDRPDAKTVPIIAMTANAYDSDKTACYEVGMNAHLAKPINTKQLYQTLMMQLSVSEHAESADTVIH